MKIQRLGQLASVALVGSLALTACGSDNNNGSSAGSGSASSSASSSTSASSDCPKGGTLNGEGSSAQKNAIEEAISSFQSQCAGTTVNYNPTGSGAGIKQFIAGQVDFAGSDSALKTKVVNGKVEADDAAKTCGSPAWDLPMVTGPIAVSFNVKGVSKLVLTPAVIANIFNGKVTTWNDPSIAKLNSGVTLPSEPVKVFFRSDESGTTENFTKYLAAAAPTDWTAAPAKKWTGKGEGKEKSAGVANAVKTTEGGITYAEWSYAKDNKLSVAQVDNGAGPVELSGDAVGKAVAAAKISGMGNDLSLKLDYATKQAGAYPILLVTYEIVCSKGKDAAKTALLKSFLKHFASSDTQQSLESIGYAPLPDAVRTKVDAAIAALS
ncbi:phosphate ABC transporter substrate-binding protein PstS [Nostocoides sp. HKS02]|uniref:phosphate ABC transporter substrate-binding protein PstS n=1 Tax=Nostocoides sp. HKS02 TaxID=1813880 RepID=UPI0012B4BE36|nr:phosphate ABC transporter substrate-binding protein PstS [Tetrasphaera sp. HKS02]QGN58924.1 phosphate ABC transporter substrate-binding protein PstS [Tetrasphaera sp. HKS02]